MLGKFLITYLLSFAFIFSGKVFVFMLGDQHALGNSTAYYITSAAYYIFGIDCHIDDKVHLQTTTN